jgi:O-antigen/teichoic acid export membrane protein
MVRLLGNLILTRLLFPEAFGLMAVVYILMIGLALFSDMGISQGIVRGQRGEESDYLNTAWTIQIVRGITIFVVTLLVALILPTVVSYGWVPQGSVYSNPRLPWLIAAFSTTALIQGFESTKTALSSRRLQFAVLTKIELASQGISLACMLFIAWRYQSIWALVAGGIISIAIKCTAGHIFLPGQRNSLRWDKESVREIVHFGKWIFLLSILGFLGINGDRLILADLIDASEMGVYSIAFLLSNMVNVAFSTMLGKVVYPALSEVVRLRPENTLKVYGKLQFIADLFLFGVAGVLFMTGNAVVEFLYDNRYHAAGHMLEILSLGLIGLRYAVIEQYCMVVGAMRYLTLATICRITVLFVGLPLGYRLDGMDGALAAIVASQFAGWPIAIHFKIKHGLKGNARAYLGVPIFVLAAGAGWLAVQLLSYAKHN